jgi:Uncharacterized protein conserved in archaea (DUF2180)
VTVRATRPAETPDQQKLRRGPIHQRRPADDCAATGTYRPAVAVCVDCGAGVCIEHAVNTSHWLTRTQALMRVERVEPPARSIRGKTYHAARTAHGDVTTTAAAHSPS